MELHGLHHVTAVTGHTARNVAFYTQVLGMRLVKKTVNQDDVAAYHLFYGDEVGHAGTEVTFFDWPHAIRNRPGAGTIAEIGLRVDGEVTLRWWAERLDNLGGVHGGVSDHVGRLGLAFADPEGQHLRLVDDGGAAGGTPWAGGPVPAKMGIRGLNSVTFDLPRPEATRPCCCRCLASRAGQSTRTYPRVATHTA